MCQVQILSMLFCTIVRDNLWCVWCYRIIQHQLMQDLSDKDLYYSWPHFLTLTRSDRSQELFALLSYYFVT